jgi:hypothetical protein
MPIFIFEQLNGLLQKCALIKNSIDRGYLKRNLWHQEFLQYWMM